MKVISARSMENISGVVIKGMGISKKLGFASANIILDKPMAGGVYSGKVRVDSTLYSSVIFVTRNKDMLEAHLLDFNGDLYGKKIEVKIIKKIRNTMDFNTNEELIKQIRLDIQSVEAEK